MARAQGKPVLSGSLDSLVSTCTNATAGLIIIALVTMITVGGQVGEIVKTRLGQNLSPEAVREVREQRENLTAMLDQVRKTGGIPTVQLRQNEYGGQDIRDLVADLEVLTKNPEQLSALKNAYDLSRIIEFERMNASWQELVSRYRAALSSAKSQTAASKIVSIPEHRPASSGMAPVFFICQGERIFPFHVQALAKQFQSSLQQALGGPAKKINDVDLPKVVQYFEDHDVGDAYIQMRVDHLQGSLIVSYRNRQKIQGEPIEQIRRTDSQFTRYLRTLDPAKNIIQFIVWSDSFELYNEARQMVSELKFNAGWEPQNKGEVLREIIFGKSGEVEGPSVD